MNDRFKKITNLRKKSINKILALEKDKKETTIKLRLLSFSLITVVCVYFLI
jgi:hypothetical protein